MLYGILVAVLVIVSLVLIVVILLQGGRGGLGEALGGSGSQSLFGGGTNMAIAKFTTIGVATFFGTCLVLAMLSTAKGRSVLEQVPAVLPDALSPSLGEQVPPAVEAEAAPMDEVSAMDAEIPAEPAPNMPAEVSEAVEPVVETAAQAQE